MSKSITPGVPGQEIDPSAENTPEADLLAEVEATDNAVIDAMPRVDRAAFRREILSALRRATWAAEKLAGLEEAEEPEAEVEEDEEEEAPVTEPMRPHRTLALLSDGSVALSVAYVEGADLAGRERWEGIILDPEESERVRAQFVDACAEVGAHVGGSIRWRKKGEPEGSGDDGKG